MAKRGVVVGIIGENIHIISKSVKEALIARDEEFILNLAQKQIDSGIKIIDLNIGPAKGAIAGSMAWLVELLSSKFDVNFSLDTTNSLELESGFKILKNPENCFLNSASAEPERLEKTVEIAAKYGSNLVALTLNNALGIPKTSEERLELAFEMVSCANEAGIENGKIYIDPLVLPVSVDQTQAGVALESIRMFKESFDPEVKTVIGLSNISNGSYKELRPVLNRAFLALALGAGLDYVIADGMDTELINVYRALRGEDIKINKIYKDLFDMSQNFGEIDDLAYDKEDKEAHALYSAARVLLNKEIYTHSFIKGEN